MPTISTLTKLSLATYFTFKSIKSTYYTFLKQPRKLTHIQKTHPTALVIGASSGIGREFVKHLARCNFDVIAVARRINPLNDLRDELALENLKITPFQADISNQDDFASLFNSFSHSTLGVTAYCAGLTQKIPTVITQISTSEIDQILKLNLITMVQFYQKSAQILSQNKAGLMINFSSSTGVHPCPFLSIYSASKSFVLALVESTKWELQKNGVETVAAAPFWVATEMTNTNKKSFRMAGAEEWTQRFFAGNWSGKYVNPWFSHQIFDFVLSGFDRIGVDLQGREMVKLRERIIRKLKRSEGENVEVE